MAMSRHRGFTLIELLTVIAIIAILAAFTLTMGPRMIERAKLRRLDSALHQVYTALTAYYVDNSTYPPAYGYVAFGEIGNMNLPGTPEEEKDYYNLRPYLHILNYHGNTELYDEFSNSYDTVNNGQLSLLEFSPHGDRQPDGRYEFDWSLPRYNGPTASQPPLGTEIDRQLTADRRPFIYLPVNKQQFARAQRYWLDTGSEFAQRWDPSDANFPNLAFPPRSYDAFVLISVGPAANSFGLLPEPLGTEPQRDLYHITALRAYFMATRDLNANGLLDFDFRTRSQQREAAQSYEFAGRTITNRLPSETMPDGYGPYIYVSN